MDSPSSPSETSDIRKSPTFPARPTWWLAAGTLALVTTILVVVWPRSSGNPEELREEARRTLQAGQFEQAEGALARLSSRHTPTAEDWSLRARVAIARERPDEAIEALNHIPDETRFAGEARLLAGQIELRRNRMRLAESYLLRAIELDPGQIQARRELIYIYGMQLRREAIAEQFRQLSQKTPLTYEEVFLWCLIRGSKWGAEEQSESLRSYVETDPEDRWSRLALSDSYMVLGRPDEAEAILKPLPDSDPEAVERRAKLALARGEIERVEQLLAGAPSDHAGLARLRGSLALRKREAQAAIQYYQAAESIEPNNRDTLLGLSRAYTLSGDAEKAKPYREAGRRLEELSTLMQYAATSGAREDPVITMKLGQACEALGLFPEARAWYLLVLGHDPLNRDAQKALSLLKTSEASPAQEESDRNRAGVSR